MRTNAKIVALMTSSVSANLFSTVASTAAFGESLNTFFTEKTQEILVQDDSIEMYSWDAEEVVEDGGFLYYYNDYLYACYDGFSYWFDGNHWNWAVTNWSCQFDSWDEVY